METTSRRRSWAVCAVTLLGISAFLGITASASENENSQSPAQASLTALGVPWSSPAATPAVPPAPTTTTTPPTPTTVPPAPPAPTPAATPQPTPITDAAPTGYGCAAALAYLAANAAPGFTFECPGYAAGHEAMTCVDHAPECGGEHLIVISDPCPAAYMNEAYNSNSWSDALGEFTRPIDPYGAC
jgi:hypothetical protein